MTKIGGRQTVELAGKLFAIEPKPGEVYLLTTQEVLSREQYDYIRAAWYSAFGRGVPLMVLCNGATVTCCKPPSET